MFQLVLFGALGMYWSGKSRGAVGEERRGSRRFTQTILCVCMGPEGHETVEDVSLGYQGR